ncbi:MAG: Asp23/Gls24 family envelope stress response protein [Clostridia bacterium]|nr:Asp23/Gls24 family envelope stress response protein [Clostridia bacterium]
MKDSNNHEVNNRYANLISSIAGTALSQTEGVAKELGLVKYKFGLSTLKNRNIHVYIDENRVIIDLYINVVYGHSVPDVVCNLQERIKQAVETATRYKVESINVNVSNIIFK